MSGFVVKWRGTDVFEHARSPKHSNRWNRVPCLKMTLRLRAETTQSRVGKPRSAALRKRINSLTPRNTAPLVSGGLRKTASAKPRTAKLTASGTLKPLDSGFGTTPRKSAPKTIVASLNFAASKALSRLPIPTRSESASMIAVLPVRLRFRAAAKSTTSFRCHVAGRTGRPICNGFAGSVTAAKARGRWTSSFSRGEVGAADFPVAAHLY